MRNTEGGTKLHLHNSNQHDILNSYILIYMLNIYFVRLFNLVVGAQLPTPDF